MDKFLKVLRYINVVMFSICIGVSIYEQRFVNFLLFASLLLYTLKDIRYDRLKEQIQKTFAKTE